MFNEKTKKRFLNAVDLSQFPKSFWNNVFKKSEILEEQYNKDLYNFSKEQILIWYKLLDSKSLEYLSVINYNIIKYVQWALQESLIVDGMNHFAEITDDEIFECVNKYGLNSSIITKEELDNILFHIPSSRDKFVLLALFEGIKGINLDDVVNMKLDDINRSDNTVNLESGKKKKISNQLIQYAIESADEKCYDSISGRTYKYEERPGHPVKVVRRNGTKSAGDVITKVIRGEFDVIGVPRYVTFNSIYTSGLIHQINQFADQDNVSAAEVLNNPVYLDYLKNQYGHNKSINKRFLLKYKEFLR